MNIHEYSQNLKIAITCLGCFEHAMHVEIAPVGRQFTNSHSFKHVTMEFKEKACYLLRQISGDRVLAKRIDLALQYRFPFD